MSALSTILCGNTIIALLFQLWVYLAPLAIQMMHEGLLSLYCKTYDSMSYSDLFNHLRLSPAATYFMVNGAHYGSGLADNFIRAGKPAYMLLAEYAAAALFILASLPSAAERANARARRWRSVRSVCRSRRSCASSWARRSPSASA